MLLKTVEQPGFTRTIDNRLIIAADIDDCLAHTAFIWTREANKWFDLNLRVEDHHENWPEILNLHPSNSDYIDFVNHFKTLQADPDHIRPISGAQKGIELLSEKFEIIPVTSRPQTPEMIEGTHAWLEKYFPQLARAAFAGIYASKEGMTDEQFAVAVKTSKAKIYQEIGASGVFDNEAKHVRAACNLGLVAVLYEQLRPAQLAELPGGAHRTQEWLGSDGVVDIFQNHLVHAA